MEFKVGDRVRITGNLTNVDKEGGVQIGEEFVINKISGSLYYGYITRNGHALHMTHNQLKLVSKKSNVIMNLTEKFALAFKGEPEKSFIKAGVMNSDESLTTDGKELFLAYLLKKNGPAFKTEVIDPILAEEAKAE